MKRARTDDASIEQRVREIINPVFDEWIGKKIDAAELDRRRELAHKQATAEHSGSPTAVASWATAAAETGVKSVAEARCAATGPASLDAFVLRPPLPALVLYPSAPGGRFQGCGSPQEALRELVPPGEQLALDVAPLAYKRIAAIGGCDDCPALP